MAVRSTVWAADELKRRQSVETRTFGTFSYIRETIFWRLEHWLGGGAWPDSLGLYSSDIVCVIHAIDFLSLLSDPDPEYELTGSPQSLVPSIRVRKSPSTNAVMGVRRRLRRKAGH